MEHNIGVGVIVGLAFASSIYVWENKSFTKTQKTILLACIIFVPLQWILIPIILYFNKIDKETSPEGVIEKKEEEVNSNLKQLKEKGILTDEEYNQKVEKLEAERLERDLKNSTEYKQLKNLFESKILTKEEFEDKVKIIKSNYKKPYVGEFRIVDGFSEGLGLAINSELDYGFVDGNGNIVIDFIFDHAENFKEGVSKVKYRGESKVIDKQGNFR